MLSTKKLISNLNFQPKEIILKKEDDFDFNKKSRAYLLIKGEIISYGERDYTQLLNKNDPIGFAESILTKQKTLKYKRLTDIILLEFDAKKIRNAINNSDIVIKAIIKYSLARIFSSSKASRKSHYLFEEEFIQKNWKLLDTKTYNEEAIIFSHGHSADHMFFIEKGQVRLLSNENKLIKILNSGESFGEIALIRGRKRLNSAISVGETILMVIKASMITKLIKEENSLVQLVLISLAKKLEIVNGIRSIDHYNKLKKEGLIG
jgi:hypothetical protein